MCCPLHPLVGYYIIDGLQLSSVLYIWGKFKCSLFGGQLEYPVCTDGGTLLGF